MLGEASGALVQAREHGALARARTYSEPLDWDIALYAVIAHEWRGGRALYTDLWEHKPPGVYATFAAAEAIAGYGRGEIYLLEVAAGVATMVAVYVGVAAAVRAAGKGEDAARPSGLVAAALWAIVSGDLAIFANQPNVEVVMNACLAGAFALVAGATADGRRGISRACAVGALLAWATLQKHVAVAPAFLLIAAHALLPPGGAAGRRRALGEAAVMGTTIAVAWGGTFLAFAVEGHLAVFVRTVVTYSSWYARRIGMNALSLLDLRQFFIPMLAPLVSSFLLLLAGLFAAALGRCTGPARPWGLFAAYAVGAALAIVLPGQLHPHYYQLLLPPAVIAAGLGTASLTRAVVALRLPRLVSQVAPLLAIAVAFEQEVPAYGLPPDEWSLRKYGPHFAAVERLAPEIDRLLLPDETFYAWGAETGLWFLTRRSPPSGKMFALPLIYGPLATTMSAELLADLDRAKPELIVIARTGLALEMTPPGHPFMIWFTHRYVPLPPPESSIRDRHFLFMRRGGALEARLLRERK